MRCVAEVRPRDAIGLAAPLELRGGERRGLLLRVEAGDVARRGAAEGPVLEEEEGELLRLREIGGRSARCGREEEEEEQGRTLLASSTPPRRRRRPPPTTPAAAAAAFRMAAAMAGGGSSATMAAAPSEVRAGVPRLTKPRSVSTISASASASCARRKESERCSASSRPCSLAYDATDERSKRASSARSRRRSSSTPPSCATAVSALARAVYAPKERAISDSHSERGLLRRSLSAEPYPRQKLDSMGSAGRARRRA